MASDKNNSSVSSCNELYEQISLSDLEDVVEFIRLLFVQKKM
jgi:hypothetical protein